MIHFVRLLLRKKVVLIPMFVFASVGFVFTCVFIAMQFGWLNVKGSISSRNGYFNFNKHSPSGEIQNNDLRMICQINVLSRYAPLTSVNIHKMLRKKDDSVLIDQMIASASRRFEDTYAFNKEMNNCLYSANQIINVPQSAYVWADTDQWNLMKEVFIRDQEIIKRAARDAGIEPRLILSGVIGEQFRFFGNRREAFKSYFEPLKILASLSQISFGIAGIKPKTVGLIEEHLQDRRSPFYLGPHMENVISYNPDDDIESVRMTRITDTKDPYYSYLYVGLFMRQILVQWEKAGYPIYDRPDVLATLYNLGFYYSVPKINPQAGGAVIDINGTQYTFGDLGYEFYYSGELSDTFPIGVK